MKNSERLDRFIKRRPHYRRVFLHTYKPNRESVTQWDMARIVIGLEDNGDIFGAYLNRIACGYPQTWCFGGLGRETVEITDEFWKHYAVIGRCAYDPTHEEFFVNAKDCYIVHGNQRKCTWCSAVQKMTVRTTVTIVEHEDWALA